MQAGRVKSLIAAVAVITLAGCSLSPSVGAQKADLQQSVQSSGNSQAAAGTTSKPVTLVSIPESDCEIRRWYNYQVVALPVINQRWKESGRSLEERARQAFDIRHRARINARYMMAEGAELLRQRDMAKYGNPDGPTFTYLIDKSLAKGMTRQQAWQAIIETSSRTDNSYNAQCIDQVAGQN